MYLSNIKGVLMSKEHIRFKGEASHYLGFPKTTRIVSRPLNSNATVTEMRLQGIEPEDLDKRTIMIEVELPPSPSVTGASRRGKLTEKEERAITRQYEFMGSYRDQFD